MAKAQPKAQPTNEELQAQLEAEQKDRDAGILVGGPGQEAEGGETGTATPSEVEVTLSGKKVKVNSEIAQLLEQREKEFDRKLQQTGGELGELRKFRKQFEESQKRTQAPADEVNYDTLFFERPSEALSRFKREILGEITSLYQTDKKQENFWRNFYSRHNDLDPGEDEFIVQAVVQRHWGELSEMAPSTAQDKIADLTRQEILRLSQKFKSESGSPNRTMVEPSSSPRIPPRQESEEDKGPKTLSALINARRKQKINRTKAA